VYTIEKQLFSIYRLFPLRFAGKSWMHYKVCELRLSTQTLGRILRFNKKLKNKTFTKLQRKEI
jgi:hypothetical protein